MDKNGVIYANAVAGTRIARLLTAEQFQRLVDCRDAAEAEKLLREAGYVGESLDEMFRGATDEVYAFVAREAPVAELRAAFLARADYHNAKVLAKCKYLRREPDQSLLLPHGRIAAAKLAEGVLADNYLPFPVPMARALEHIDAEFAAGRRRSRLVDFVLTQALYEDLLTLTKPSAELEQAVRMEIDCANISSSLRVRSRGLPGAMLDEEWIAGGTLTKRQLKKLAEGAEEAALAEFRFTEYGALVAGALAESRGPDLADYELAVDNLFTKFYKRYKYEQESLLLFYGAAQAMLTEIKNVRIVCGGLRAGLEPLAIKAKLRDPYV